MSQKTNRYRMDECLLHKKRLGKHTLTSILIRGKYSTESYAGVFYHYTSPEGLKGILQSRTIFFSDCQYLNDYRERININDDLDSFGSKHKNEYDKEFYSLLHGYHLSVFEDNKFAYMESDTSYGMPDEPARYFVLSTSTNLDSLGMWRCYTKNELYSGYCIGLATYALTDEWIDRDTGVAIEAGLVIYNSEDKQQVIFAAVEKLYEQWCTYKVSNDLNEKIKRDYESWVAITSLFFKDKCFADEEEYRFIAIAPTSKLKSLQYDYDGVTHKMFDFRLHNGVFIPYIKMPFFYWNEDCWAINSIGIGPSMNIEQKRLGVEQFIRFSNYTFPDLHIYNSEIPLRY